MNIYNLVKLTIFSSLIFSSQCFAVPAINNLTLQLSQKKTTTQNIIVINQNKSDIETDINTEKNNMQITNAIRSKIADDSTVSRLNVNVSVDQGVVTLIGDVDTKEDATALVKIAQSTPGVKDVDTSKLTIQNGELSLHDFIITAKIKGLFIREELFSDKDIAVFSIEVDTKNSVVFLTGTAENQAQIDNAIKLVKSVKGVQNLNANITIKNSKK